MKAFHRSTAEKAAACLPLGMASTRIPEPEQIEPRKPLTLHHQTERCANCLWPPVCTGDETCWRIERDLIGQARIDERAERLRLAALDPVNRAWTAEEIVAALKLFQERNGKSPTWHGWLSAVRDSDYPNSSRVVAVFGSWVAGLAAAGMKPNPRRKAS